MSTRKVKDAQDLTNNELIYFKGHAQATYMSDGTTVEDAINNISNGSGGSSGANVQTVDTGDVIDDVTVNYATKAYVDELVGDINSVLESIINGGVTPTIITFTISGTEYQAEEGMTFYEWGMSKYYDSSIDLVADMTGDTFRENCETYGNTSTYCYNKAGMPYTPSILLNSVIQPITYVMVVPN